MNKCRFCGKELKHIFLDLGVSPLANSYVPIDKSDAGEVFLPLKVEVCDECFLVQLREYESPKNIFSEYAYLSSFSTSWVEHAKNYVDMITEEEGLNDQSQVIEIASNDGYLLQFFKEKNIPTLGIEPSGNVAEIAKSKGIETIVEFFGAELATDLKNNNRTADLIVGNNVLAHVPDLNGFVEGVNILLKEDGIATFEFPYLIDLMRYNQFDTIYHEHFSYFSFFAVNRVFASHGMKIFKVDRLDTHGGSLRIYACHSGSSRTIENSVRLLIEEEKSEGIDNIAIYETFMNKVEALKIDILSFLIDAKKEGKKVCGYGAPAKGNTLLNYCGVGTELLDFTVDKNPLKQNTYLPGCRIPVMDIEQIEKYKPDYLVILPWNIKDEIVKQEEGIREWGGKFVTFIPMVDIF